MSASAFSLAILGGPESGKTTYLGALADAMERVSDDTGLRLSGLPDDTTPMDRLTQPLRDATYPPHTSVGARQALEVPLRLERPGLPTTAFTLRIGDYDGEEVERLFRDRTRGWSAEWQARALASHLLLFIQPGRRELPRLRYSEALSEQERWLALRSGAPSPRADVSLRAAEIEPSSNLPIPDPDEHDDQLSPAHPRDRVPVPTVLAMVELLQFIRHVRNLPPGARPPRGSLRIALLVSAWDGVDLAWRRQGPGRYLLEHATMLEEFLWSNFHQDDVFRFGLSSTGGNLKDPTYQAKYRDDPRGFVEWADGSARGPEGEAVIQRSADLGLPLYWVLHGDRAFSTG